MFFCFRRCRLHHAKQINIYIPTANLIFSPYLFLSWCSFVFDPATCMILVAWICWVKKISIPSCDSQKIVNSYRGHGKNKIHKNQNVNSTKSTKKLPVIKTSNTREIKRELYRMKKKYISMKKRTTTRRSNAWSVYEHLPKKKKLPMKIKYNLPFLPS